MSKIKTNSQIQWLIVICMFITIVALLTGCAPKKAEAEETTPEAIDTRFEGKYASLWSEDYPATLKKAFEEQKLIFINFTGSDWCIWCHRLDDEVFSQDVFMEYATENFILFKADFPQNIEQPEELEKQNRELLQKFEVQGFPTIIVIDENEKVVAESGYIPGGAENWIAELKSQIDED